MTQTWNIKGRTYTRAQLQELKDRGLDPRKDQIEMKMVTPGTMENQEKIKAEKEETDAQPENGGAPEEPQPPAEQPAETPEAQPEPAAENQPPENGEGDQLPAEPGDGEPTQPEPGAGDDSQPENGEDDPDGGDGQPQ